MSLNQAPWGHSHARLFTWLFSLYKHGAEYLQQVKAIQPAKPTTLTVWPFTGNAGLTLIHAPGPDAVQTNTH